MSTSAKLGLGLSLQAGNGSSPQTFTAVAEVKNISGFGAKSPLVDATHYGSTLRDYIPGIPDGSEITATANYRPTNVTQKALITDYNNGTTRDFHIVLPAGMGGNTWMFSGIVLGFVINPPVDGVVTIDFTIKITGSLTSNT